MQEDKALPVSIRKKVKAISELLSVDSAIDCSVDRLDSVGVERVATALNEGWTKDQICKELGITKTIYNKWYLALTPDQQMLIHLSTIDIYTELQDKTLKQLLNNQGVISSLLDPKRDQDGELTGDANRNDNKFKVQGVTHKQLLEVYSLLERKIKSEHDRKPETQRGNTTINQNNIIIASGKGGFQPPPANLYSQDKQ